MALLRAGGMAAAFAINGWFLILTSEATGGMAALWSANAILLFMVMDTPRAVALQFVAGAFVASIVINTVVGFPAETVAAYTAANLIEVGCAALFYARLQFRQESSFSPRNLVCFVIAATFATLVSATVATSSIPMDRGAHWLSWFLSDFIGLLLVVPSLAAIRDSWHQRAQRKKTPNVIGRGLSYVLVIASSLAVFTQSEDFWMFLLAVPILVVVFQAGRLGAVMSICVVAVIAVVTTSYGFGPITAETRTGMSSVLYMQSFLACQLLISIPVAAILEKRQREGALALERERSLRDQAVAARRLAEQINRRMALTAARDSLTGLYSRARTLQKLNHRLARAARRGEPMVIALFDIDHFKRVNDRFGHVAGDEVLCRVSAIAQGILPRRFDIGRIGGEEFLAIMQGETMSEAIAHAERLRRAVMHESTVPSASPVTISIGLARYRPGATVRSLMIEADAALYEAKALGRNRFQRAA